MTRVRPGWGCIVLAVVCLLTTNAPADVAAEVKKIEDAYAAGQYRPALEGIAGLMPGLQSDDDKATRYQLLMIKGESLLRTDNRMLAVSAFEAATKNAVDARALAVARANALLVRASPDNKYTPKTGENKTPIDILDPAARKNAFLALRADMLAHVKGKINAATEADSLPPIIEAVNPLLDLGYLEYAADGAATQTKEMLQGLGERARGLINRAFTRMSTRMNLMESASNTQSNFGSGTRVGLTTPQRNEVAGYIDELQQIEQIARNARRRARELSMDGNAWEPIIADAADLMDRAKAMLDISAY